MSFTRTSPVKSNRDGLWCFNAVPCLQPHLFFLRQSNKVVPHFIRPTSTAPQHSHHSGAPHPHISITAFSEWLLRGSQEVSGVGYHPAWIGQDWTFPLCLYRESLIRILFLLFSTISAHFCLFYIFVFNLSLLIKDFLCS